MKTIFFFEYIFSINFLSICTKKIVKSNLLSQMEDNLILKVDNFDSFRFGFLLSPAPFSKNRKNENLRKRTIKFTLSKNLSFWVLIVIKS